MSSELPEDLAQQIEDKSDGRTGEFRSGARWGARAALEYNAQKVEELTLEIAELRELVDDGQPHYIRTGEIKLGADRWKSTGDRGRELRLAKAKAAPGSRS